MSKGIIYNKIYTLNKTAKTYAIKNTIIVNNIKNRLSSIHYKVQWLGFLLIVMICHHFRGKVPLSIMV